jgi:hypothetical protein
VSDATLNPTPRFGFTPEVGMGTMEDVVEVLTAEDVVDVEEALVEVGTTTDEVVVCEVGAATDVDVCVAVDVVCTAAEVAVEAVTVFVTMTVERDCELGLAWENEWYAPGGGATLTIAVGRPLDASEAAEETTDAVAVSVTMAEDETATEVTLDETATEVALDAIEVGLIGLMISLQHPS